MAATVNAHFSKPTAQGISDSLSAEALALCLHRKRSPPQGIADR